MFEGTPLKVDELECNTYILQWKNEMLFDEHISSQTVVCPNFFASLLSLRLKKVDITEMVLVVLMHAQSSMVVWF